MSYLRHQRFDDEACSLGACGSGVWASPCPQARSAVGRPLPPHPAASLRLPANQTKPNFALRWPLGMVHRCR